MADDHRWYPPEQRDGESTSPPSVEPTDEPQAEPSNDTQPETAVRAPVDSRDVEVPTLAEATMHTPAAQSQDRPAPWRRRLSAVAIIAGTLIAATVAASVGLTLGRGTPAAELSPSSTSTTKPPATSTTTTSTSTPPPTTTPEAPIQDSPTTTSPPVLDISAEAPGLYCRDLADKGYSYPEAVGYWQGEGEPSRMDASGTGIPCQTVYPAAEVEQYWGPQSAQGGCPGRGELESAFLQLAETDMRLRTDLEGMTFQAPDCLDGWATARLCQYGGECIDVYIELVAGQWVARDFADGASDEVCSETIRSEIARAAMCPEI
jgi:hypothetical protein